jgi:methionyl-tRNA synthetase
MSKFFVTTPIYYINDKPHIGHTYASLLADVLARFHRQHNDEVWFLTGTDENSQKTVQSAEKAKLELKPYSDQLASTWQEVLKTVGISFDRFIRTTEAEHAKAVHDFIKLVDTSGDIYKGEYEGLYCVGCEEFKRPEDLVEGKCPNHQTVPEKLKEENYFFRLSKYQQPLLDYIKSNPGFITPESRRNEVIAFINRGLIDISISRPSKGWGIPWPGDKGQVVYVWFDALINYLTGCGFPDKKYEKWWPANVHVVGKDIIKFHCSIWPAMLMSAGLRLPEKVVAHGFFTIEGTKISKSLGNAIDPVELVQKYGVDALRYYLLREIPLGSDGDFSYDRFETLYTTELANDLGNLVQRTASMVVKYLDGQTGPIEAHSHDATAVYDAIGHFQMDRALGEIWQTIRGLNQLIEEEKPWVLAKTDASHLKEVLLHLVADLLQVADLLLPFLPETAAKISHTFADGKVNMAAGVLFPKLEHLEITKVVDDNS